jgi:hypothetical protein
MVFKFEIEGSPLRVSRLSINEYEARIGSASGVASDGRELPFSVQLAILFKVYRMTLRFHSVLSLSPVALASTSAGKSTAAGVPEGMDFWQ